MIYYVLLKNKPVKRPFALISGKYISFNRLHKLLEKFDYIEIDGTVVAVQDESDFNSKGGIFL